MPQPVDTLIKYDVDLQSYNTLNISARAKVFAQVKSVDDLRQILHHPVSENNDLLVLGGGSNILFKDDFDGVILHVEISDKEVIKETEHHVWLKIGAGESWHQTVRYAVEKGWGGIENLSLIPGTVGAAPIQNIGAYGVELEDVFECLEAVSIEDAEKRKFKKEECNFGYRDSIFKNELKGKYIVIGVVLKLSKQPKVNTSYGAIQMELEKRGISEPTVRDISDVVIAIRNSKLPNPAELGNAGSFFKNPVVSKAVYEEVKAHHPDVRAYPVNEDKVKIPAGWLIEQTGWKGKVKGSTGTYKNQALVIVNYGGATGEEILQFAKSISESVEKEFGIELVPEVNIV